MIRHGLWQSAEEVENVLMSYGNTTDKLVALKAQLKFRKEVLHQTIKQSSTSPKLHMVVNLDKVCG